MTTRRHPSTEHFRSRWSQDEDQAQPGSRLSEALTVARLVRRAESGADHPSRGGLVRRLAAADSQQLVVDLRPSTTEGPGPSTNENYGLGRDWGSGWSNAAQGWVDKPHSGRSWRPIVTTTTEFPDWDVDTYLGVIAGESAVDANLDDAATLGHVLAEAREVAMRSLVDAAVERGAHAVVGVTVDYTPLGQRLLVAASGTAVTLRKAANS